MIFKDPAPSNGSICLHHYRLEKAVGSSNVLLTDKAPGYELGAGLDVSFLGVVSLTPQVRYVGQNLKMKVAAGDQPGRQLLHLRPRPLGSHAVFGWPIDPYEQFLKSD